MSPRRESSKSNKFLSQPQSRGLQCWFLFCFESFICNPLHAARRAMAAAVPLPLRSNGGIFYGIPVSYLEPACAVMLR